MALRTAPLLEHLHRLAAPPAADAVLLERFARHHDEAAFAALVARHGPMVLRLCRRAVGDAHAAEDCFQAVFLVLARRASSIRRCGSLAAWLYSVARQVAGKARAARARRREQAGAAITEPVDPRPDPLDQLIPRELLSALDQEVAQLPETYRLPVLYCCLEGLSQEEAARRLGWTPGSVKGRLERGRARLHARLARRGLTLAAALAAAEVAGGPALAAAVAGATARAAALFAARVGAGRASHTAITLAEGVLHAMLLKKLTLTVGLVLTLGLAVATWGLVSHALGGAPVGSAQPEIPRGPAVAPPAKAPTARNAQLHWGDAQEGLRIGLAVEESGAGQERLAVALENVGKDDLVINLGVMLANGRKQFPSALGLALTDAKGATRSLRRSPPFVAGRVDPFVVPLGVGCRYTLRFAVADLTTDWGHALAGAALAPGRYRAVAHFDGKAVTRDQTNQDTPGLALMPYWKGTVRSGEVVVTVPAAPAGAPRLEATLRVNGQSFLEGETDKLIMTFTMLNKGDKVIDPDISGARIIVNGKELVGSSLLLGNGPRDVNFDKLPPGQRTQFAIALGDYFKKPGVYRVSWEGRAFRAPEIVFRVLSNNEN
jgi:RNA polymerase sigma-70 factor (ECF subfamily)